MSVYIHTYKYQRCAHTHTLHLARMPRDAARFCQRGMLTKFIVCVCAGRKTFVCDRHGKTQRQQSLSACMQDHGY